MERTKAEGNISSIVELGDLIQRTFEVASHGFEGLAGVSFYQEYPLGIEPKDLTFPMITYAIMSKESATMRARSYRGLSRSTQEIRPRTREEFPDKENTGYSITTSGQTFDCLVQFDVWAASNKRADIIAEAFEHFMHSYTGVFLRDGIKKIMYLGYDSDDPANWKDKVAHKKVQYHVVLESLYVSSQKTIEDIQVSVDIPRQ